MMDMPLSPRSAIDLIAQLRDALKHSDRELQRRCVISGQVREAIAAAEGFLNECGWENAPLR